MSAVRAVLRFLNSPLLSAAGNISLLIVAIPFVLGLVLAVTGKVIDQPALFVVAVVLGLVGLAALAYVVLIERRSPPPAPRATAVSSGDLARRARYPSEPSNRVPGRAYGGTAFGEAVRRHHTQTKQKALFIAVEAEIALAREETLEMAKILRSEWPHITPEGAVVRVALPDWRTKTTAFIGVVLGSAQRAAFKGSATGADVLERLEPEGRFLGDLALKLTPESIRVDEAAFLKARGERREHEAASFLDYNHERAPGAPPPSDTSAPSPQNDDDSGEFGRRDDRGELAKRCHMLAASVEKWVLNVKEQEGRATAKEWLENDAELDPAEAVRRAHARYEKNCEADYRFKYEGEARKLFQEAWEMHEVAKEHEQLALAPLAIQFEQIPRLFNEIADRLYEDAACTRSTGAQAQTPWSADRLEGRVPVVRAAS